MDLTAIALTRASMLLGWGMALPVLLWALSTAPWKRLLATDAVNVVAGGIVCEIVLWTIKATVADAFTFHLLGVTGFTLAAGPQFALLGTAVAVALQTGVRGGLWQNAGIAFATMAAIPVTVSWAVHVLAQRRLPANLFVFIFAGALFGAFVAMVAGGLAGAAVLVLGADLHAAVVFGDYAPYLLYLGWGEAVLTGMLLTLLVVYRPQWIVTFDDSRYLRRRD